MVSSVEPELLRLDSPPPAAAAPGRALATDTALPPPEVSEALRSTVWVERATLLSGSKVSDVV